MSERKFLTPEFGPLSGIRILGSGSAVAMPSAGNMLADLGAEFIHIERPGKGDITTRSLSDIWHQEARNRLSLTLELDLHKPEIKETFMDLIKHSDVFMENQVWLDKFGIYDEELLAANPKLVIVHVSGFGSEAFGGAEGFTGRASYDIIGQAFSGYLSLNGSEELPYVEKPYTNDFVTALWVAFSVMSALRHVEKTGEGQIIDVSQYEAMARITAGEYVKAQRTNKNPARSLTNDSLQPFGLYRTKGNDFVAIASASPGVYHRVLDSVGFDKEAYPFDEVAMGSKNLQSEKGQEFDTKFRQWCLEHTADEVDDIMAQHRVPCSKVNTMQDVLEHPHFESRNNWAEYENKQTGFTAKSFGAFPHFSKTPGKVWRGAPDVGDDTEAILKEIINLPEDKIQILKEKGYI